MANPGYISNRMATETVDSRLKAMADFAMDEGKTPQDQVRLSASELKTMGAKTNNAYEALDAAIYDRIASYEAKGGQVTVGDLADPTKRGNVIKTIKLVDKDDDGKFEVPEVRSSSSDMAKKILAASEQRQTYSLASRAAWATRKDAGQSAVQQKTA